LFTLLQHRHTCSCGKTSQNITFLPVMFQYTCLFRYCYALYTGNGISDEYHVIRHVMNLEAVNTYEGDRCNFSGFFVSYLPKISLFGQRCQADILLSHGNILGRVHGHIPDKK